MDSNEAPGEDGGAAAAAVQVVEAGLDGTKCAGEAASSSSSSLVVTVGEDGGDTRPEWPEAVAQVFSISELILAICQFLTDYDNIEAFLHVINFNIDNITSRPKLWQRFLKKQLKNDWSRKYKAWGGNLVNYLQYLRGQFWMHGKFPLKQIVVNDLKMIVGEMLRLHLKCEKRLQVINVLTGHGGGGDDEKSKPAQKHSTYCITSIHINRHHDLDLKDAHLGVCIHISQLENLFMHPDEKGENAQLPWGSFIEMMNPEVDGIRMNLLVRSIAKYDAENRRRNAGCSLCQQGLAEKPTLGFTMKHKDAFQLTPNHLWLVDNFYDLTHEVVPPSI